MLGVTAGVTLTVALLAIMGIFLQASAATMTQRALRTVPIDWQVQLVPGANQADIVSQLRDAAKVDSLQSVGYADVTGFELSDKGTVQATGGGKVVGVDSTYWATFPGQIRILSGGLGGAVLLQQTAANLHATPGSTVHIHRPGLPDVDVTITGIIDLTNADGFFQAIGLPANAAPQAPPDNAAILPITEWMNLFGPQAQIRPDSVRTELHVMLDQTQLPHDPAEAFAFTTERHHNFEARVAGSAILSDNLAARLLATLGDALYVRVLFLFLGTPGIVLACLLTFSVAASGADRRRRDISLLKLRGASLGVIFRLMTLEALAVGAIGSIAGIGLAAASSFAFPAKGTDLVMLGWDSFAAASGLTLACLSLVVPAWRQHLALTVSAARQTIGEAHRLTWDRLYLDVICLALAGAVYWQTAATGYQVVLAPEGVPATSVDYWAFLAPFLLWIGIGLMTLRVTNLLLEHGRRFLVLLFSKQMGIIAESVASSLQRQRRRIAMGAALIAIALAFGVSTALFNTTYQEQALADAQLTNGSDVTVTGTSTSPAGSYLGRLEAIPGVVAAAAIQHRYAYVGSDLQDLYGIDPRTIRSATTLADAYFGNGDAARTLAVLDDTPSAVLVSQETVNDFQLNQGDTINLRLQGADHQYHIVPFVFAGVAREFPTAPLDSFLVANASYVAKMTGVDSEEIVLVNAGGQNLDAVQRSAAALTANEPGIRVSTLAEASRLIASSLTSISLAGLTRIELTSAILLVIVATGLILALGLADRRRSFAILSTLGASKRDMSAFIWSEGALMLVIGLVAGGALGAAIAQILVQELQGVFDPPPEHLVVPWPYLSLLAAAAVTATTGAVTNGIRQAQIDPVKRMRQLQ
jgi:putative ABC transport system permease protein